MPNWCFNSEVIDGPKAEVKSLHKKLVEWTSKNYCENGFGTEWLGNIVGFAGFKRIEEDEKQGFPCRGNISSDFEYEECGDEAVIRFTSLTAYVCMPELWYAVIDKFAPHCKYYYFSEEPSNAFYMSNDKGHKYFDDFIVVDVYYDEEHVPETIKNHFPESSCDYSEEEVVRGLQDILKTDESDIDKLIEEFKKKDDMGGTGYLQIYKVSYEE